MVLCPDILLARGIGRTSVQETFAPILGPGETFILNFLTWDLVRHHFYLQPLFTDLQENASIQFCPKHWCSNPRLKRVAPPRCLLTCLPILSQVPLTWNLHFLHLDMTAQCTVHTVENTMNTAQCTMHSSHCTLYPTHCTMHTAQ